MNNSREKILNNIRHALNRQELSSTEKKVLSQRLENHIRGVIPKLNFVNDKKLIDYFITEATAAATIVHHVTVIEEVISTIEQIVQHHAPNATIRIAPRLEKNIPWKKSPTLKIDFGTATPNDDISITDCFCGVAETGTLVMVSTPETPTLLNFLPKIQIVLLSTKNMVKTYEDAWDLIRKIPTIPRTVNFITGPSRTGDIEQKILLGVHGPKQIHIILYSEGK